MSDLIRLSYSGFTTLLDCGEKFRLTRIDMVEEAPAWYLIGGSAVHSATEHYDRATWAEASA